jgi:cysteine desulfurase/selenocysteine lyase
MTCVRVPRVTTACTWQRQVDVEQIRCHVLTATGRKFLRGPRATGLLYVAGSFIDELEPCMLDQHGALLQTETSYTPRPGAARFEMWEQHFAGKLALGVAITYALKHGLNAGEIERRSFGLAARLRQGLEALDGLVCCTDAGWPLSAIVTFTVDNHSAASVVQYLAHKGISASVSGAASGGSRVWFDRRKLDSVVRVSPHVRRPCRVRVRARHPNRGAPARPCIPCCLSGWN